MRWGVLLIRVFILVHSTLAEHKPIPPYSWERIQYLVCKCARYFPFSPENNGYIGRNPADSVSELPLRYALAVDQLQHAFTYLIIFVYHVYILIYVMLYKYMLNNTQKLYKRLTV